MSIEQPIGSILVVDCGSVLTKAVLIDRVDGAYRFIARGQALTTIEPPWQDVSLGVQHAIEQIEDITGRVLLDEHRALISPQEAGGRGVDAFLAIGSGAPPVRVMVAGLVPDLSLANLNRAVSSTYSVIEGIMAQAPGLRISEEEQVQMILDRRPDVICIAGGTDGGATLPVLERVQTATLACMMMEEEKRPRILFAGNTALRERAVRIVGGQTDIHPVDNVLPALGAENASGVRAELETMYQEQRLANMPGGELLARWSVLPILPTATAFGRLVYYLWYLDESPKGTLGIDVGAANTTVAAVFDGQLSLTVQAGLGSVYGGRHLLKRRGDDALTRWLPTEMSAGEVMGVLLNQEIYPGSVPGTMEELWIEQAVVREAIREALRTAQPGWAPGAARLHPHLMPAFDPILVSGGALSGAPHPGQIVLMVLDAVEPVGISTLLLDTDGLAPVLGAVASLKPLAAVETLDGGGIVNLATVIAPVGVARRGETILRLRVHYEEGGSLEVEVPYGSLEVLPLPPGQEAVLELRPRSRFDVGLGGPGRGGKRRVRGGLAGLIIDARGRPLRLSPDPVQRREQMQQWLWDVGG